MAFSVTSVDKKLRLVPVEEGLSPRAKSSIIASDVQRMFKYLNVPATFGYNFKYVRQLLFQYNVTFTEDFYLLNVGQYKALAPYIIIAGCLCIKWRHGNTVYRYRLLDSDYSVDWSYFPEYKNQLIKKNFCIEFWGNAFKLGEVFERGLIQNLVLQLSSLYDPTTAEELPVTTNIDSGSVLKVANLGVNLPENLPYNQNNIVWLDN